MSDMYYEIPNQVPVQKKRGAGLSIASFICSLLVFIPCLNSLLLLYAPSLCAIIFGIIALCKKSKYYGLAIAGLIIGAIALVFEVASFAGGGFLI